MEIKLKILLIEKKLENFYVLVNDENHQIVKLKLIKERDQIIDKLKGYQRAGLIKSIHNPKNKKMREHLSQLVKSKRSIKKAIQTITSCFK